MNHSYYMPIFAAPDSFDLPLRDLSLIIASVVLAHVLLLWFWVTLPDISKSAHHEMSVSIVIPSPPQAAPVQPKPMPPPLVKPKPAEPQRAQPAQPAPPITTPDATSDAPVVPAAPVETPAPRFQYSI